MVIFSVVTCREARTREADEDLHAVVVTNSSDARPLHSSTLLCSCVRGAELLKGFF